MVGGTKTPGWSEFHLTLMTVKKIKHLAMQKSEKRGRISANPQPHATKKLSVVLV